MTTSLHVHHKVSLFLLSALWMGSLSMNGAVPESASEKKPEGAPISEVFVFRMEDLAAVKRALSDVMGPGGRTVFLYDQRKVLVQDQPEHFDMIRAVMREFAPSERADVLGPMVQVEIFFDSAEDHSEKGLDVSGGFKTGGVEVITGGGGNNRVRVNAVDRRTSISGNQTTFLTVQSGSWSRLNVTREVSRPVYFYERLRGWGYVEQGMEFERAQVGTVLEVAAEVRGSLIDLELTPVITAVEPGGRLDFRVREMSTRVTVASGTTLDIGSFNGADSEFNRYFFGGDRRQSSQSGVFRVRARIIQP
ncbi:MAG: hypothetical protein ACFCUX_03320 [Candidatus Methylacidiphilales bacterium]